MSSSCNYSEEALVGRESLFRRKLSQLRNTGEIQRLAVNGKQPGFKEIEQSFYLDKINSSLLQGDPNQLEKLVLLDTLTELYNHNTICRMLKEGVNRSHRYKKKMSILAIAIDSISRLPKECSFTACESVVKRTAQSLIKMIRDVDLPGRFDREHFLVICPETELTGAVCLAERLINHLGKEQNFETINNLDSTISVGIVAYPNPAQNDQQMLDLVFKALKIAEQSGGNTIRLAK